MFKDINISYETYYAEQDDVTFVMKVLTRFVNGKPSEMLSMEVVALVCTLTVTP